MPSKSSTSSANTGSSGQLTLSKYERRLYAFIKDSPEQTATSEDLDKKFESLKSDHRVDAINGLLNKSLVVAQQTEGGIQFQAQSQDEARLVARLEDDEQVIYGHIKEGKNEGMWTKILRNRSGLHSSVVTRVLKSLESKGVVKTVKSVKFPTRKIYMLASIEPSVELSGGPWYTDNELDRGFIDGLLGYCEKFIQERSWPKDGQSTALYPSTHIRKLPTAPQILTHIRRSKLTSVELSVGDIQTLLDVLVWDGKVEKVPIAGGGVMNGFDLDASEGSVSDGDSADGEDEDSDADSLDQDDDGASKKRKRKDNGKAKNRSNKKRKQDSKSESGSDDEDGSDSEQSRSGSDHERTKAKKKGGQKNSSKKETPTSFGNLRLDKKPAFDSSTSTGSAAASVSYRAVRSSGDIRTGFTQVPCGHCPVFDFCSEDGPVNPRSCEYMHRWVDNEQKLALGAEGVEDDENEDDE